MVRTDWGYISRCLCRVLIYYVSVLSRSPVKFTYSEWFKKINFIHFRGLTICVQVEVLKVTDLLSWLFLYLY